MCIFTEKLRGVLLFLEDTRVESITKTWYNKNKFNDSNMEG